VPQEDRFEAAHRRSSRHREEVLQSDQCRCFYCLASFKPDEITDWIKEDPQGEGETAKCPRCGIDSVIGSASGFPLDDEFFGRMRKTYFW
jgi:hypothetical protein